MSDDFQCRVVSHSQTGVVEVEQQSCSEIPVAGSTDAPRTIEVVQAIFPPEKLNVIDINAKRRYLIAQGFDKNGIRTRLGGIFANPKGGTAEEALAMPDFSGSSVIAGGIYFANTLHDWPQTGEETRQGDGFVYFKPDPFKQGNVLSEEEGHFTSGGTLFVTPQGETRLVRKSQIEMEKKSPPDVDLNNYRLVVQSNLILVADGAEDHNRDDARSAVSALSVQKDGRLSLVVAYEPEKPTTGFGLTPQEFGRLLVDWGSVSAINLDGGPSVQFSVRKPGCNNPEKPAACIEDLVRRAEGEFPNPMPQLFSVE